MAVRNERHHRVAGGRSLGLRGRTAPVVVVVRGAQTFVLLAISTLACCAGRSDAPIGKIDLSLEDGRISAAIRTALLNDPDLGVREIAFESRGGIVSLWGCVQTMEEAQRAQTLAATIEGVREVKSALRVDPFTSCGARDASTAVARPLARDDPPRLRG